jgi:carboxyl-terminal processing protease
MSKSVSKLKDKILITLCLFLLFTNITLLFDKFLSKQNTAPVKVVDKQSSLIKKIIQEKSIEKIPTQEEYEIGQRKGLVSALQDPYSQYFTSQEYDDFSNAINQKYEGIGIRFEKQGGGFVVLQVFDKSPAKRQGVLKNDIILEVDGQNVSNLTVDQLASRIKGPQGTAVKLKLFRGEEFLEVETLREKIQIDLITFTQKNTTGIITISSFGEDAVKELDIIAAQIKNNPDIKDLIVDLRSNNGGLLDSAIDLSSYFLKPDSVIVKEKNKISEKTLKSKIVKNSLEEYPVRLLVDSFTASSSEIMAGALRDNRQIKLYGQKTYGKGVVQQIFEVGEKGLLKLTVEEWFTPSGSQINKLGLEPDVLVDIDEDSLELALTK